MKFNIYTFKMWNITHTYNFASIDERNDDLMRCRKLGPMMDWDEGTAIVVGNKVYLYTNDGKQKLVMEYIGK